MLDFLNDLNISPNCSFQLKDFEEDKKEQKSFSQFVKKFELEEDEEEISRPFEFLNENQETNCIQITPEKPKKLKRRRGNKKDDFDYNKYIEQELRKIDTSQMDKSKRKKLIQKIRNRMSAQRSRLRQKKILVKLEKENEQLKNQNKNLQNKIHQLLQEKNKISENLDQIRTARHSISTDNESDHKQENETIFQRNEITQKNNIFKRPFLFMFAMFMILFMLQGDSLGNSSVKMAGFSILKFNRMNGRDVNKGVKLLRRRRVNEDRDSQLPLLSRTFNENVKSLKSDSIQQNILVNKNIKRIGNEQVAQGKSTLGKLNFDTNTFQSYQLFIMQLFNFFLIKYY